MKRSAIIVIGLVALLLTTTLLAQIIGGQGRNAPMAPSSPSPAINHIASNSGTGVNTVVITVPAGGVPAGAAVGLVASDTSNVGGSVTDTAGDGFFTIAQQGPANAVTAIFAISTNGSALAPGATITYTLGQAGKNASVEAFYVTGVNLALGNAIVDSAASSGMGTGTTPSSTTGVPFASAELFIGVVASASAIASFTQDSTNAAWVTPPGQVSIAAPTLVGGSVVNPTITSKTYAPVLGSSVDWAELVVSLRSH